jgi:glyceraldehyde 3-phosphate dehydrogenase
MSGFPSAPVAVGINGFGRIGRLVLRLAARRPEEDVRVTHINDPSLTARYAAYLLRHDSVHGAFEGDVEVREEEEEGDGRGGGGVVFVRGRPVRVTSEPDPKKVPWSESGVFLVVDATGKFLTAESAGAHLLGPAGEGTAPPRKVLLTAPPKDDAVAQYVVGVNEHRYAADAAPEVFSAASCTTNCLAPLAKIVDDAFGIEAAVMTTVHALTVSQPVVDAHCAKDWRRGRSGLANIVPTTSGATRAVGKVLPRLDGKLAGLALRVPVADVSVVDLTVALERPASLDAVKAAVKHAAEGAMEGIVGYEEEPKASSDFVGDARSCVFDAEASVAAGPNLVKLIAWYDNEWGYAARVIDLIVHVARAERERAETKKGKTPRPQRARAAA